MHDYFLGIDIGTSAIKTIIMDNSGNIIDTANAKLDLIIPKIGWAEQRAEDWWRATVKSIKDIISKNEKIATKVKGIGLSGQMIGLVALDKNFKTVFNPIIWLDQRASLETEYIKKNFDSKTLLEITGNIPLTGYLASKILWVKKNKPKYYKKIYKIVFPKDYIRFLLTNKIAVEVSDLQGTYLFNLKERNFSNKMLELFNIPRSLFPSSVLESEDVAGYLCKEKAEELGLRQGIPVVAGGGDQPAGAVGCGSVKEGNILVSIGTSGVVLTTTEKAFVDKKERAMISSCHCVRGKWVFFGCTLSAGGSLNWVNNNFISKEKEDNSFSNKSYDHLNSIASEAPIGSNELFFLPYLNGERSPYPDPDAKGIFFGLTLSHGYPEIVRSVMEGVSYSLRDIIEIFKDLGLKINEVIAIGGGAKSPFWRQILADVFNKKIIITKNNEGPAAGAAILAMVGTKYFKNTVEACNTIIEPLKVIEPIEKNAMTYNKLYSFYHSLYPQFQSLFKEHSKLKN